MADKQWGSVKPFRGKWRARAKGGGYIGLYDTEDEGWRKVDAWRRTEDDTAPDTLRRFGTEWLDDREVAGHIRGVKEERSYWRQHIETAPFIDWPMRRIKPIDVQRWLGQLAKKEARSTITTGHRDARSTKHRKTGRRLSRQTIAHARRVLRSCLAQARIEGKITANPADGIPVPKMDRVIEDEDSWSWLTLEEIDRLLDAVTSVRLRAFYAVAIYGGLRDGELLGLRWQDVVLDGRPCLKVRRSYDGPTKTRGSRRDVPLLTAARDALRAWQREGGVVRARGLVFGADHGGCHARGYDGGWPDKPQRNSDGELVVHEGWRSKARIRDHVRFHDLRHTCASHLVMGSWGRAWSLHEVMHWLGHSDIKTTMRYAHLAPDALLSKAAELVELGTSLEQARKREP